MNVTFENGKTIIDGQPRTIYINRKNEGVGRLYLDKRLVDRLLSVEIRAETSTSTVRPPLSVLAERAKEKANWAQDAGLEEKRDRLGIYVETIHGLYKRELSRANNDLGKQLFHSPHEGYATIKEEIEESVEEVVGAVREFKKVWDAIRADQNANDHIEAMQDFITKAIGELIQAGAMCEKYLESEGTYIEGEEGGCE